MSNYLMNLFVAVRDNSLDAWVPEHWAHERVLLLIENMVAANVIHRDFSEEVAQFGDVVNTRKPGVFEGKRKTDTDDVTVQDATATNIPVPLDQHFHVSFLIRDGEESKSFSSLIAEYLSPAVVAIAQSLDKCVLGQHVHFMENNAGGLGEITSSNAREALLDLRKVLNVNKAYVTGRNLILGPALETTVLKDETFTDADKVGDDGSALREASLGRKLGFNIFMCQNMSEFTNTDVSTADDLDGAILAGATAVTLTTNSATVATVGDMITIAGDMTPQRVTAVDTVDLTIDPGVRDACLDAAVVTTYDACLNATARDAAYAKYLTFDNIGTTNYPKVGQQIAIGTASVAAADDDVYTIIDVDLTSSGSASVLLDRPLDAAIVDNAIVSLYPTGNYGWAFHRNAVAMVSRPLAQPKTGAGALSAVVSYDNIGIRVVITYDGDKQGHLVTVDLLCGFKVLDTDLGAVLLG